MTAIDAPAGHTVDLTGGSEISNLGEVLLEVTAAGGDASIGVWRHGATDVLWPVTDGFGLDLDMSDQGHVVGLVPVPGCAGTASAPNCLRPALWARGESSLLPVDAPVASAVLQVSDRGMVAANLQRYDPEGTEEPDGLVHHLVAWRGGEAVPAPMTGRVQGPVAVNERGEVAVSRVLTVDRLPYTCGAVWRVGGGMTPVEPCDRGNGDILSDMNRSGQVTGFFWTFGGPDFSFVWRDGQKTWLPGFFLDINDRGEIVGQLVPEYRAALWRDGTTVDLGTLGGARSWATAVNEHSQVVGASATADGEQHAFLWEDGQLIDLGAVAGAETSSTAVDINDRGQVLGTVDGRPVVWTVQSE